MTAKQKTYWAVCTRTGEVQRNHKTETLLPTQLWVFNNKNVADKLARFWGLEVRRVRISKVRSS